MRSFRPAALLAVLGALGMCAAFVSVLRGSAGPGIDSCRGLASRVATERCLVEAMLGEGSPVGAARLLDSVLADDEMLLLACHEATHEVGERLLDGTASGVLVVSTFLVDSAAPVCEWGLVHGLLAAVTAAGVEPDAVEGLLDVCVGLPDPGARQACGDSVGHALWEVEGSFPAAVQRCLTAPSPTGDACVAGVFMQLYRPVAPSGASGDQAAWSAPLSRPEVRALCASLPAGRAGVACAAAAHYAFAPELTTARDRVLASGDPVASAARVFVPVLEEALGFCSEFPAGSDAACAKEVVRYALQMLRYLPSTDTEDLVCGRAPAGEVLDHCRKAAAALL